MIALLISILSVQGCALSRAIDQNRELSPAQIRELRDSGMAIDGCITVAGPPPSGATTWIIRPWESPQTNFTDGCHISR